MNSKGIQIGLLLGALLAIPAWAQAPPSAAQASGPSGDNGKSLAEIARDQKKKISAHAHVITEDDLQQKQGPLPKLDMDEDDSDIQNTEDVIEAIGRYKSSHTPEETEEVVHSWYDRYNDMLHAALNDNKETMQRNQFSSANGYLACHQPVDYQACQQQMMAQQRISRSDQADAADNYKIVSHIQHAFFLVRSGLVRYNLQYSWFKVRSSYY